jgi:hypothetical protein
MIKSGEEKRNEKKKKILIDSIDKILFLDVVY